MTRKTPPPNRQRDTRLQSGANLVMDRYPLAYSPASSAEINENALPSIGQYADMELAVRDNRPVSEGDIQAANSIFISWGTIAAIICLIAIPAAYFVPWYVGPSLAGAASLFSMIAVINSGRITRWTILYALGMPIGFLVGIYVLSVLLVNRWIATVLLFAIAAWVLHRYGKVPFEFQQEWMRAHPRLRPETRRAQSAFEVQLDWATLGAAFAILLVVPYFSRTLAIVLVFGLSMYKCLRHRFGLDLLKIGQELIARNLTYGHDFAAAPGVWFPNHGFRERWRSIRALAVFLYLPLTIATGFFMPSDLMRGSLVRSLANIDSQKGQSGLSSILMQSLGREITFDGIPKPPPEIPRPELRSTPVPRNPKTAPPDAKQKHTESTDALRQEREAQYERDVEQQQRKYESELIDFFDSQLRDKPHAWLLVALASIVHGDLHYFWCIIFCLLAGVFVPNALLVALFRRPLLAIQDEAARIDQLDNDDRSEWQWYPDRLRSSPHVTSNPQGREVQEAQHLFYGLESRTGTPVLVDRSIVNEHCYFVGETGSGKTSLGIMPLIIQLIRGFTNPSTGQPAAPHPMIILDLKGDAALFQTVRAETEARGQKFLFFTPEKGKRTYYFNPFQSLRSENRTITQLCELMLDSLSLSYGEGYGRSYYTRQNRMLLHAALKMDPPANSFEELYRRLAAVSKKTQKSMGHGPQDEEQLPKRIDAFELLSTIQVLTAYPMLTTVKDPAHVEAAIHMPTALEQNQVVYFWLPAALESVSVREIGKLALFSLLSAAIDRQAAGLPRRQAYLVIDEFQRIAGSNFKIVLEQARSFGIGAMLANQSLSDLDTPDIDLRSTVRSNTRLKQYFSITDPKDIEMLSQTSGQEVFVLKGESIGIRAEKVSKVNTDGVRYQKLEQRHVETSSFTEALKPRFVVNDILGVNDHPNESIVHVSRGAGYTQYKGLPLIVHTDWPLTRTLYESRQKLPWPDAQGVPPDVTTTAKESPVEVDRRAADEIAKMQDTLADYFQEQWKPLK